MNLTRDISFLIDHTTLKIGGRAQQLHPKSLPSLVELLVQLDCCRVLGNGSNLLVSDHPIDIPVVCTKSCRGFQVIGDRCYVETGCLMPRIVNTLGRANLGGLEYFASIPGTLGGAIYMNAGRGEQFNLSISQAVVYVDVFDMLKKAELRLSAEQCVFGYRKSIFHEHPEWVVLGAMLQFTPSPHAIVRQRIQQRLSVSQRYQDLRFPNAGTTFCRVDEPHGMRRFMGIQIGGAAYSSVTPNWVINLGGASFDDGTKLLEISPQNAQLEWSVWT